MTAFDLHFSLLTLLLGLALVQVLAGLVQAVQSTDRVKLGLLTPLLSLLVILDLTTFWTIAWSVRDAVPARFLALVYGLAVMALYYFAASLVFPAKPEDYHNLDEHFFRYRRTVVGAIVASNLLAWLGQALLGINPAPRLQDAVTMAVWLGAMAAAALVTNRKLALAFLLFLLALYVAAGWFALAGL